VRALGSNDVSLAESRPPTDAAETSIALSLEGVTKRYGETTAVDDLSLSVRAGEFFTLVGPSGCGKTTTLRLIAGFETPTAGSLTFGGVDVTGVPPEDRDIGVVFQNYALFPHLTVGENIGYGLKFTEPPGGVSRAERVSELLELVDLSGMADRDPDELSGGQQQRVAIARALAPGPDILLLDEPMSALDAQLRERLRVQVKSIQRELGITTIYVTHDQEEALAISDRVAVMHAGSPEQIAPPEAIYRRPKTPFVATFIGDNNVFNGTVLAVESVAATVDTGTGTFAVALGDRTTTIGEELTFCVRPEQFTLESVADGPEPLAGDGGGDLTASKPNTIRATVESAEFLGETTRLHLDYQGRSLIARTQDPVSGTVTVSFDAADTHILPSR